MRILMIGDIFAKTGRRAIHEKLKTLREQYGIDYVIANAENATHGKGITKVHYEQLMADGIDFFTMGNHTWDRDDIYELLMDKSNIIRPYNIDKTHRYNTGLGTRMVHVKGKKIQITNLLGSTVRFRNIQTNPFLAFENILATQLEKPDIHIVDFHAETTSEKNAFFRAFCGRVSVIVGTHTHVQTNDAQIKNGTAYLTDLGMTGPADGIIGTKTSNILDVFYERSTSFMVEEEKGRYQFCGAIIDFEEATNKPTKIQTIYIFE